jgi:KaiC/GvpD/RAD55 family RecA-like ATPase/tetratricopeptide (TPR) repeat protein
MCNKLFQQYNDNNGLLISLNNASLESLLKKAKELEKKYEWLEAIEFYQKAITQPLGTQDFFVAAELQEKIGYCYFRTALQAQQSEQNKKRMKQAVKAYEDSVEFFEKSTTQWSQAKIIHNKGWILFLRSWLENDFQKKKELLDEWWKLETNNFNIYDELENPISSGEILNDLLELSAVDRFFFTTDNKELKEVTMECIRIGEKAIQILSTENNIHELARAYCWTGWYYTLGIRLVVFENKKEEFGKQGLDYSKEAIKLSQKDGDAWLIGWSNNVASNSTLIYEDNLNLSEEYNEVFIKQGRIAKDNYMLSVGLTDKANRIYHRAIAVEDPDKQREGFKKVLQYNEESKNFADLSNYFIARIASRNNILGDMGNLAAFETNLETKNNLFRNILRVAKENLKIAPEGFRFTVYALNSLSNASFKLSETLANIDEKHESLNNALNYKEKVISYHERFADYQYLWRSNFYGEKAGILLALAKIEEDNEKKSDLLESAILTMNKCLNLLEKGAKKSSQEHMLVFYGKNQYVAGRILCQLYALTRKEHLLNKANELFDKAIENYKMLKLLSNLAESYWQKALIHNQLSEHLESAKNYRSAAEAYLEASEKLPKLKEFYMNHSRYMLAWSEIEQAKYNHSRENYLQAKSHYDKAGRLHVQLDDWNYLSSNYFAWAKVEQAEELSRTEKPQEAIEDFQGAIEYFQKTEINIKTKINENPIAEVKDLLTRILLDSDVRQKYCQARILMEKAKLLGREGKYLDSSISYGKAAQTISAIVDKTDADAEQKELKYIAILCQAWEKMALAEETASSESYMDAAALFEKAKNFCFTKKASLWALGNSSFCKGLAAGIRYKTGMDLKENALAKRYIKDAASSYFEAGFKNASEYAKATQRLFDAYVFMNQAESEVEPEKKAKQYQMAENLLQIAAGSFMKAKQPEKTAQVQLILKTVREEKKLAVSLNEVLHAPAVASTTLSFATPAQTSEVSVGLEQFEHANVQANLVANISEVKVGESFSLSVEFVNAGREPALLMRVEEFVPPDFVVVKKPEIYRIEETCLNMKGKQLAPLKLVEVKLTLQPSKKGKYQLNPRVHYLDEFGQNRSLELKSLEIKVDEVILADRVSTGTKELDSLMLGGIPEGFAVVLTGPPSDERELLIKNFLEAGTNETQITFYVTAEADGLENLLEKPSFILFLCNPKPKAQIPDLPNVYKLGGKTDLTSLGIALTKAYRTIDQSATKKRVCVGILSEVLVNYGAKTTREWISELITNLGSKGFTLLAVINPTMHPPDQANAVLDLFDGEISLIQTEDPLECKKSVRVKKLRNQDYIKNPICLTNK